MSESCHKNYTAVDSDKHSEDIVTWQMRTLPRSLIDRLGTTLGHLIGKKKKVVPQSLNQSRAEGIEERNVAIESQKLEEAGKVAVNGNNGSCKNISGFMDNETLCMLGDGDDSKKEPVRSESIDSSSSSPSTTPSKQLKSQNLNLNGKEILRSTKLLEKARKQVVASQNPIQERIRDDILTMGFVRDEAQIEEEVGDFEVGDGELYGSEGKGVANISPGQKEKEIPNSRAAIRRGHKTPNLATLKEKALASSYQNFLMDLSRKRRKRITVGRCFVVASLAWLVSNVHLVWLSFGWSLDNVGVCLCNLDYMYASNWKSVVLKVFLGLDLDVGIGWLFTLFAVFLELGADSFISQLQA
ncbi:hypothetical protein V6N12_057052 [Hibiscus sabdariffa]|uniref:Uncharacterized protein n=1 Tax=Hibiscus sabdariffa TaxID=183260 RepID=A0ABR2DFS1_9ROSI